MQHPEVVKIGYFLYLTPKIDVQAWTDLLTTELKKQLSQPLKFALVISKINDGLGLGSEDKKRPSSGRGSAFSRRNDNMAVHVETIKSQQLYVKRALDKILANHLRPE